MSLTEANSPVMAPSAGAMMVWSSATRKTDRQSDAMMSTSVSPLGYSACASPWPASAEPSESAACWSVTAAGGADPWAELPEEVGFGGRVVELLVAAGDGDRSEEGFPGSVSAVVASLAIILAGEWWRDGLATAKISCQGQTKSVREALCEKRLSCRMHRLMDV
ncbi:hypothetical protein VTK26DRAFT_6973 [Humicola hyalothermophila]